ncbi:MAG: glycosyltransferase [Deltaproteobacteria bacterium]|nr:glycosyltransferase [Deltaproteobacteria bacterium]
MRFWLITVGEPLPVDGASERLMRTGLLAAQMVGRGHDVVWWTSTFDHYRRVQRSGRDRGLDLAKNYRLVLLHAPGYRKNISLRRILNHALTARKFVALARSAPRPDLILCSLPTIELSLAAARYGAAHGVPVILDARDMWPDIIVTRLAAMAGPLAGPVGALARAALRPAFRQATTACRLATGIAGITDPFVDWALGYARRDRGPLDRAFPLAYSRREVAGRDMEEAYLFWEGHSLRRGDPEFVVCLFAGITRRMHLEPVIEAARRLERAGRRFRFVLCGEGVALAYFRRLARDCRTVLFPGWIRRPQIEALMHLSRVGLAPVRDTEDFRISILNKAIEYMSAGLPVVSSIRGLLEELLRERGCGVTYDSWDAGQLCAVLCDLDDHPAKVASMAEKSRELFQERFVAEKVYREMADYLEQTASCKQR